MEPTKYVVNTNSSPLKVRNKPNGDDTGISMAKGTSVLVTEINGGWAKITQGWVSAQYLLKENADRRVEIGNIRIEGRAPWMKVVLEEAMNFGGYNEGSEPLKSRIKNFYFSQGLESLNTQSDPSGSSWCASFASWCLQTAGYSNPRSQRALEFNPDYIHDANTRDRKSGMRRIAEPVYGCIIVWKNKSAGGGGHVAFYFGKDINGQIIALGGNQGNSIQFSTRNPNGDIKQSIVGYFLPENYQDNERDNFTENDKYQSTASLNSGGLLAKNGIDSLLT